jgi:hypothetical protein
LRYVRKEKRRIRLKERSHVPEMTHTPPHCSTHLDHQVTTSIAQQQTTYERKQLYRNQLSSHEIVTKRENKDSDSDAILLYRNHYFRQGNFLQKRMNENIMNKEEEEEEEEEEKEEKEEFLEIEGRRVRNEEKKTMKHIAFNKGRDRTGLEKKSYHLKFMIPQNDDDDDEGKELKQKKKFSLKWKKK